MPRGGRRTGQPGTNYPNRSDLRGGKVLPVAAATGQTYGKAAEQVRAQRSIPLTAPAPPAVAPPGGAPGRPAAAPAMPAVMPGQVTPLDAPSERPGEPVTAGLPMGAGPGVEALGALGGAGSPEDAVTALRAAYSAYPSEDLRMILERIDLS